MYIGGDSRSRITLATLADIAIMARHPFLLVLLAACRAGWQPAPAPAPVTPADVAPVATEPKVPEALAAAASRFGLAMKGGWTWRETEKPSRFQWTGRPSSGDREALYSFFMEHMEEPFVTLLPSFMFAAASNLTDITRTRPCEPFEQPREFAQILGVDRVVTVCFQPSEFYAKEFHHGVMHGIVRGDALTIVAVLSNEPFTAVVPLADAIGAGGMAR